MIHGFLYYRFLNALGLVEKLTGYDIVISSGGHSRVGGSALFGDALSLGFLGLVVLCSYLSYALIEKPGQDWSRRLSRRGSEPVARHRPEHLEVRRETSDVAVAMANRERNT